MIIDVAAWDILEVSPLAVPCTLLVLITKSQSRRQPDLWPASLPLSGTYQDPLAEFSDVCGAELLPGVHSADGDTSGDGVTIALHAPRTVAPMAA